MHGLQPPRPPGRRRGTLDEARWAAFARRDAAADGQFIVCVRTTRIYCRPSCPARRARRENVMFVDTCAEAERLGFRPCLRCHPKSASLAERHAEAVARACRTIREAEEIPALGALAESAGLSPYHFHRIFKSATGVTPRAYARQHRASRVADALREADSVTGAIYDAGFNAASRFYETAGSHLGMTPTAFRAGGAGATIRFAVAQSWLGCVLVAATQKGVCAILIGDAAEALLEDLRARFPKAEIVSGDAAFEAIVAQVIAFTDAPQNGLALPLDVSGTAFQQRVWHALRAIPAGRTASYTEIAAAIGAPRAVRAVASACRANPVALAIPCHRILRSDGGIADYRWGVARKRALIAREAGADG